MIVYQNGEIITLESNQICIFKVTTEKHFNQTVFDKVDGQDWKKSQMFHKYRFDNELSLKFMQFFQFVDEDIWMVLDDTNHAKGYNSLRNVEKYKSDSKINFCLLMDCQEMIGYVFYELNGKCAIDCFNTFVRFPGMAPITLYRFSGFSQISK